MQANGPHSGWLVQGVYYALDENSRLIPGPLSPKQDNVQVSLTVADLAGASERAFCSHRH